MQLGSVAGSGVPSLSPGGDPFLMGSPNGGAGKGDASDAAGEKNPDIIYGRAIS